MKKVIIALVAVLMAMVVSCHTPHEGVPDTEETVNIKY